MSSRLTLCGPKLKMKAYVCVLALLATVAGGILGFTPRVMNIDSRVAKAAAGNVKLEVETQSRSINFYRTAILPRVRGW